VKLDIFVMIIMWEYGGMQCSSSSSYMFIGGYMTA